MRILYIEDEPLIREVGAELFECYYPDDTLDVGADYDQGASFLGNHTYDIIVSDFKYPDKGHSNTEGGGIKFYQLAVQTDPNVPFYFLSGSDVDSQIRHLPEYKIAPPRAVILKPKRLSDVIQFHLKTCPTRSTPSESPLAAAHKL